ncbi:MAG: hypothetical protein KDE68_08875 [Rhodocyclaceae bacterium]|nr:hypothetical protein [Rhodocyclaceae bacterium]
MSQTRHQGSPVERLCRLLEKGNFDANSVEWLAYGFRRWLADDGAAPSLRHFGLPSTPRRLGLALRDHHLKRAALLVPGKTPWHRARLLSGEIERYQSRKATAWSRLPTAPAHASEIEAALHAASRYADLPGTPQAVRDILEADY